MMTRPEMIAQLRVVIAATGKFPRLGRAFYEAGPCYGVSKLAEQLRALTAAGALDVPDPERAARQFIDLCKSGVFNAVLFGGDGGGPSSGNRGLRRRRGRGFHARLRREGLSVRGRLAFAWTRRYRLFHPRRTYCSHRLAV